MSDHGLIDDNSMLLALGAEGIIHEGNHDVISGHDIPESSDNASESFDKTILASQPWGDLRGDRRSLPAPSWQFLHSSFNCLNNNERLDVEAAKNSSGDQKAVLETQVDKIHGYNRASGDTPLTYLALQAMIKEETANLCERMQRELRVTLEARAQVDVEL